MNCKEIIKDYLAKHGYDGLYLNDPGCSCGIEDLMPCGEFGDGCHPGYKHPCDCGEGCDFHVGPDKPEASHD